MKKTDTKLLKMISGKIKDLYDLHDYTIDKVKLIKIAQIIYSVQPPVINENLASDFFLKVNQGVFGQFFNSPTCLTAMYQKYIKEYYNYQWSKTLK